MLGEMPTDQARELARQAGLDLVEINAETRPPLCKITDYGKYKYELSKKSKGPKQKSQEMKEVRLGRSMKIDDHDVEIRVNQARRFLMEGHKVQIVAQFRGREMAHKGIGIDRLREITESLSDISKIETPLRSAGRRMNVILAPERQKIEQIKRKLEAERAKAGIAEAEEAEDQLDETVDGDLDGVVETAEIEEDQPKKSGAPKKGGNALSDDEATALAEAGIPGIEGRDL